MINKDFEHYRSEQLEIGKVISFDELVLNGLNNGADLIDNMPQFWTLNGKSVKHYHQQCYTIETIFGVKKCTPTPLFSSIKLKQKNH
jgi:hypothetical protein